MSITAGQDSDARTYTSDGALATRAVMRTSANGTTQRLEAWGYSALSLPEWYSLRSDAAAAGSTCTPDATLAPQHLWRYRYGPQQEREQKREWENGTATQPLHWTYWLLGADGKQLATYHGVQGGTCGGAATDVALWPVEYAAYAPLGTRVITRSNGTKEIVLADHLGSSRVVLAQQGYIAQSTAYTAYGEISHSEGDGARTGFIGRFAEPEGSFNLHGVRFYDPDAGSFTAVDPLWSKYAAWTPYQYAGNQPTVALDWNGREIEFIGTAEARERAERYYTQAMLYFAENGAHDAANLLHELYASKSIFVRLEINSIHEDGYDFNTSLIRWDPTSGLQLGHYGIQSPALGLLHEVAHAFKGESVRSLQPGDPELEMYLASTVKYSDAQYYMPEERRVIEGYETPTAVILSEPFRKVYSHREIKPVRVTSPVIGRTIETFRDDKSPKGRF